jgi:hypothetical protein
LNNCSPSCAFVVGFACSDDAQPAATHTKRNHRRMCSKQSRARILDGKRLRKTLEEKLARACANYATAYRMHRNLP